MSLIRTATVTSILTDGKAWMQGVPLGPLCIHGQDSDILEREKPLVLPHNKSARTGVANVKRRPRDPPPSVSVPDRSNVAIREVVPQNYGEIVSMGPYLRLFLEPKFDTPLGRRVVLEALSLCCFFVSEMPRAGRNEQCLMCGGTRVQNVNSCARLKEAVSFL